MKGQNVLFSSASEEWETPQAFYNDLNAEFDFTLDPCATEANHKCDRYFTREQDGLTQDWGGAIVFFVIHHMGKTLKIGLQNVTGKDIRTEHWLLC